MQHAVTIPSREHVAWEVLKKRIDYLNAFAGNRAEMIKITREMQDAWDKAGELGAHAVSK